MWLGSSISNGVRSSKVGTARASRPPTVLTRNIQRGRAVHQPVRDGAARHGGDPHQGDGAGDVPGELEAEDQHPAGPAASRHRPRGVDPEHGDAQDDPDQEEQPPAEAPRQVDLGLPEQLDQHRPGRSAAGRSRRVPGPTTPASPGACTASGHPWPSRRHQGGVAVTRDADGAGAGTAVGNGVDPADPAAGPGAGAGADDPGECGVVGGAAPTRCVMRSMRSRGPSDQRHQLRGNHAA